MPIEFRCSQCQSLLKVGDEHAGKSARCPSCQTVNNIPHLNPVPTSSEGVFGGEAFAEFPTQQASNPFAAPTVGAKPTNQSKNPYQSPTPTKIQGQPIRGGQLIPTTVGFEDVWTPAWQCWSANLGLMVGCAALVFGVNVLFSFASNIAAVVVGEMGGDVEIFVTIICISIVNYLIQLFLNIGFVRICLKLLKRQQTGFGEMFSGADKLFPSVVAGIIFALMLMAGLIALIVPCLFVGLLFWTYFYLIVDDQAGIGDSFSTAFKIGSINKLTSFVLFVSSVGLGILGALMCYVGLLFTTGLVYMLFSAGYLKMSNQL